MSMRLLGSTGAGVLCLGYFLWSLSAEAALQEASPAPTALPSPSAPATSPTPTASPAPTDAATAVPLPSPVADVPGVAIVSASGATRSPLAHDGMVDRIGLRPGQTISINLTLSNQSPGQSLALATLDGGVLQQVEGAAGRYSYQAEMAPGLYRLVLSVGADPYQMEFYVLDLEHPERNPPRLRIVD